MPRTMFSDTNTVVPASREIRFFSAQHRQGEKNAQTYRKRNAVWERCWVGQHYAVRVCESARDVRSLVASRCFVSSNGTTDPWLSTWRCDLLPNDDKESALKDEDSASAPWINLKTFQIRSWRQCEFPTTRIETRSRRRRIVKAAWWTSPSKNPLNSTTGGDMSNKRLQLTFEYDLEYLMAFANSKLSRVLFEKSHKNEDRRDGFN